MKAGQLDSAAKECIAVISGDNKYSAKGYAEKKLAIIHAISGSHDQALEHFMESAKYYESDQNEAELSKVYTNIGNSYYQLGQCEKARPYYQKRYNYSLKNADTLGIISALMNLGVCEHQLGEFTQALKQLLPALELSQEINNAERISRTTDNIIACYNELGLFEKSLSLITQNTNDAYMNDPDLLKSIYYNAGQTFKHIGATDSAFYYFSLYHKMQDSLHQIEQFKALQEIEAKYEVATHEVENKALWLILLAIVQMLIVFGLVMAYFVKNTGLKRKFDRQLSREIITYQEHFRKSLGAELDEVVHEYFGHVFGKNLTPEQHIAFKSFFEDIDYLSQKTFNLKIGTPYWSEALSDLSLTKQLKVNLVLDHLPEKLDEFTQIGIYRISEELIRNCKSQGANYMDLTYKDRQEQISIISECNSEDLEISHLLDILVSYFGGEIATSGKQGSKKVSITMPKN